MPLPFSGILGVLRGHGWTQLEELVSMRPGTGPGTDSEQVLSDADNR